MKRSTYTVFAVYEDAPDQRFTESVEASSPEEAEQLIQASAESPLIIASVVEGVVAPVDQQAEEAKVTPIRGRGFATAVARLTISMQSTRLPLTCPKCKADLRKVDSLYQDNVKFHQLCGKIPRGKLEADVPGILINRESYYEVTEPGAFAVRIFCSKCRYAIWDGYKETHE